MGKGELVDKYKHTYKPNTATGDTGRPGFFESEDVSR